MSADLVTKYFVVCEGKTGLYTPFKCYGLIAVFDSMYGANVAAASVRHGQPLLRDIRVPEGTETLTWEQFLYYGRLGGTQIEPLFALKIPKNVIPYTPPELAPTPVSGKRKLRIRK